MESPHLPDPPLPLHADVGIVHYGLPEQVSGSGPGCSVTIHLVTDNEEDAEDIRRALAQTMANVTSQVEGL